MSWVKIDDKFHSHPKMHAVGLRGAGLFACALSYCGDHLTDGFVPRAWARAIGGPKLCKALVTADLWIEMKGGEELEYTVDGEPYIVTLLGPGYFIRDYLELNPTRDSVEAKRAELHEKRSQAGKKGNEVRWGNRKHHRKPIANGVANTIATASQTDRPVPVPPKNPRDLPVTNYEPSYERTPDSQEEEKADSENPPYLNNIAGDIGARITSLEQARERRTA